MQQTSGPSVRAIKGATDMEALGGLFSLWLMFTVGAAILYFILEPVFCWVTYAIGRLLGFGSGK
jgi:hypothetical protein